MKRSCEMRANFDLPRNSIRAAALRAGLELVKTHPQSEGKIHVIGTGRAEYAGTQCTTATIADTLTTMRLIAALAADQKDCLISCKSVGY